MNDDLNLLASAYLDGDATADERALVEAEPELLAQVEQFRRVRALLAVTEPSSISVRESLLATALAAWDRVPEAERTGSRDSTPTSLADRRRATANRRLLAAAAAIVFVLAGGIVLQVVSSGGNDDTVADSATQVDATIASARAADSASEQAAAQESADAPTAGADQASPSLQTPAAGSLETGIDIAAPPADDSLERLETPAELAIFASDAVGAPGDPNVPAATSGPVDLSESEAALVEWPLCLGADFVVGPALYGDVPVVVGVDESRDMALAYRADGCAEVARARLP